MKTHQDPQKYSPLIQKINASIQDFNAYLSPALGITPPDDKVVQEDSQFLYLYSQHWSSLPIPNATQRGVYFIFGNSLANRNKLSLYVGKASFNSNFGKGLHTCLARHRNEDLYTMNDQGGHMHKLNYVLSLPMEAGDQYLFAASLQEHLLASLKDEVHLLNGIRD